MNTQDFKDIIGVIALTGFFFAAVAMVLTFYYALRFVIRAKKEAIAFYNSGQLQQMSDKVLEILREMQAAQQPGDKEPDIIFQSTENPARSPRRSRSVWRARGYVQGLQDYLYSIIELKDLKLRTINTRSEAITEIKAVFSHINSMEDLQALGKFVLVDKDGELHIIFHESEQTEMDQDEQD